MGIVMLQIFMGATTPQKRLEVGSTPHSALTCNWSKHVKLLVICSIVVDCVCAQDTGEWIPLMHFAEEHLETPMALADPQACWPEQVAQGLLQLALDCTGK